MSDALVSPRFLFHFSLACRHCDPLWTAKGTTLGTEHILPSLVELESPADGPEVRAGWSREGLAFRFEVRGKKQEPWCRANRAEGSDGVQVWIDTRNVKNVHRAGRFCHRLFFLPGGKGQDYKTPVAGVFQINRSRAPHGPIDEKQLRVVSQIHRDGYVLHALIAADALTGFDPGEHPRLGFTYAVIDRELGEQTLGVGRPMPYQEDPSLWATLELLPPG